MKFVIFGTNKELDFDASKDNHLCEKIFADEKCKPYFDFEKKDEGEDKAILNDNNLKLIKEHFPDGDIVVLESHGFKPKEGTIISFHYVVNNYCSYPRVIKQMVKKELKTFEKGFDPNPYAVNKGAKMLMRCVNQSKGRGDTRIMKIISDHSPSESLITNPCPDANEFVYGSSKAIDAIPSVEKSVKKHSTFKFKCYFSLEDFERVCSQLPKSAFEEKDEWKEFTQFCKLVAETSDISKSDVLGVWDKYSREGAGYNYERNTQLFDFYDVECCYRACGNVMDKTNNVMAYWFAKSVDSALPEPCRLFNEERTYVSEGNDDILKNSKQCVVVKADMGTGKTEASIKHIKKTKKPFVVLTSRVSLAKDIYRRFKEAGVECNFYSDSGMLKDGESMVCEVESIMKLATVKHWENYFVMIDEADSFIEHLHMSPTCSKDRRFLFSQLKEILKKAKSYCCDADVSFRTLKFLNHVVGKENVEYIRYDKKYFSGVKTVEHFTEDTFVSEIAKHKRWIVFMDSKNKSAMLRQELIQLKKAIDPDDTLNIRIIDSDYNGEMDLNVDCVICSPSVIYGLDSHIERPVFAYYKGHTISSQQMVQQIGRERKITSLHYFFARKSLRDGKYNTVEEAMSVIEDRWSMKKNDLPDDIYKWKFERDEDENFYYEMLSQYLYLHSCFDTNKFFHFREMLKRKGFEVENIFGDSTACSRNKEKMLLALSKQEKMERLSEFIEEKEEKCGQKLNVPLDRQVHFADIYIEPLDLMHHFNYCKLLYCDTMTVQDKYYSTNDFDGLKSVSNIGKVKFIKELQEELKCDRFFNPTIGFRTPDRMKEIYNDYVKIFSPKKKSVWSKNNELTRDISKSIQLLVGKKNLEKKRLGGGTDKPEDRKYIMKFIREDYNLELLNYRRKKVEIFEEDSDEE